MISLTEAQERVARDISVLDPVEVPISQARGLVLAESVSALEAIPPFANTAMDGFALRSADSDGASEAAPITLPMVATIAAGMVAPRPLAAGEAMAIMTGAPIPDGADAVIMVELTKQDVEAGTVDVLASVPVGNHIRPAGDDLEAGTVVFEPGEVLTPAHLGVLASVGRTSVLAYRRPRVGVFSTGDELVEGPELLQPGQIRDSNRISLLAAIDEAGFEPVDLGLLRDNEEEIEAALRAAVGPEATNPVDALVTSGGVSMGEFDFVKRVLTKLGDLNWMQVAIRPAKPFAFGLLFDTPIFGLPGNPVSSMVSFELFARPSLRTMMGRPDTERPTRWAMADEPFLRSSDGKTHFVRVVVQSQPDGTLRVRSAGKQGSHQLTGLARANGLVVLPDGDGVNEGGRLRVMLLD